MQDVFKIDHDLLERLMGSGYNSRCIVIRKEKIPLLRSARWPAWSCSKVLSYTLFSARILIFRLPCTFLQMRLTSVGQAVLCFKEVLKDIEILELIRTEP